MFGRVVHVPHLMNLAIAGLLVWFVAGCSRTSAEEARLRRELSIPARMAMKNLGVLELRADTPKRVSLGPGKDCTVTATVLTNGLLQMNLAYEAKVEKADGSRTNNFSQRSRFLLPAGKQCAVKFGSDLMVVMRPTLITP